MQCYHNLDSSRSVGKSDKITRAKPIDISSYPQDIAQLLHSYNDFYSVTNAEINGIAYKTGMCLVSGFANDELVFSKIIIILQKETVTKFVCRNYASTTVFHIKAFKLEGAINVRIFELNDFIDTYSLSFYKYKRHVVVIHKYLLLNQNECA